MRPHQSGPVPRLALHLQPYPILRLAVLRAWQRARGRYHLTGTSLEVLEQITYLIWAHARVAAGHAAYAIPSERYLAEELCVARETISDAVCELYAHGLLRVIRRRPVHGRWQTNLYALGSALITAILRIVGARRLPASPGSSSSPKGALSETAVSHAQTTRFTELARRLLAHAAPSPSSGRDG